MTGARITILLVALCAFAGAAVGGAASAPVAVPDTHTAMAGGSAATANASSGSVSDCDLVDIDGDNNTVSADITANATANESSVSIQYRCGTNASTLDHDLIDVDGHNNTVTVSVRAGNATLGFGAPRSGADGSGVHVALNCEAGTPDDCDGVDIDGHNNSVRLIVTNDTARTVHEFGSNASNVSWTAGERNSEPEMDDGGDDRNGTTNEHEDRTNNENDAEDGTTGERNDRTNSGNDSATNATRSGDDGSDDVLEMIVNGIPLAGAVTFLVLGSALLVKRNSG